MGAVGQINEKYMGMRPSGYITDEDQSFLDRILGRATENIGSGVGQQQSIAATRLAQRRIGGPAAEQVLGDIGASGILARARAAGAVADVGHGIYGANQAYAQGNVRQAWNADLAAQAAREQRKAAKQAAWANALTGGLNLAGSFFSRGGVPGTDISGAGAGYTAQDNFGATIPDPFGGG